MKWTFSRDEAIAGFKPSGPRWDVVPYGHKDFVVLQLPKSGWLDLCWVRGSDTVYIASKAVAGYVPPPPPPPRPLSPVLQQAIADWDAKLKYFRDSAEQERLRLKATLKTPRP